MNFTCPHCNGTLSVKVHAQGATGVAGENGALPEPAPFLGRADTDGRAQRRRRAKEIAGEANERMTRKRLEKQCPVHQRASKSRFGGLYCPAPDTEADSGWCQWSSEKGAAA